MSLEATSGESRTESIEGDGPDYLVWAALATLCCCPPYGIAAIAAAHQVRARRAEGDMAGAAAAAVRARRYLRLSFILGLVANLVGLGLIAWALYYVFTNVDEWTKAMEGAAVEPSPVDLLGIGLVLVAPTWIWRLDRTGQWVLILGGIGIGAGVLMTWDPTSVAWFPRCWLNRFTGAECAGCGLTRGVRRLLEGEVFGAVRQAPVIVGVGLVSGLEVVRLAMARAGCSKERAWVSRAMWGVIGAIATYGVWRNLG